MTTAVSSALLLLLVQEEDSTVRIAVLRSPSAASNMHKRLSTRSSWQVLYKVSKVIRVPREEVIEQTKLKSTKLEVISATVMPTLLYA